MCFLTVYRKLQRTIFLLNRVHLQEGQTTILHLLSCKLEVLANTLEALSELITVFFLELGVGVVDTSVPLRNP